MLHISEILYSIIDAVLFMAALSFLILGVFTGYRHLSVTEKNVSSKVNVYEMNGEYSQRDLVIPSASVLSDIREMEDGITVKINGYTVTEEEKIQLKQYHDASGLAERVKSNRQYQKEYVFDSYGNVTEVIYSLL